MAMKLVSLVLLLATSLAVAVDNEAPVEQVKRLLHTAVEESKENHDYGTQILNTYLDSLEGRGMTAHSGFGIRTEPTEYSLTALIDAVEILSRSPQTQAECRALCQKLRAEMEAQDATLARKIAQGIGDILRQALAAKNAKDLEAPKAALEKLVFEGQTHGESRVNRLVNGPQYQVSDWLTNTQEVLSGNGIPNLRQWERLNDSQWDTSRYLPRSEYLERLTQFRHNHHLPKHFQFDVLCGERMYRAVQAISSPADISAALEQLHELSRNASGLAMSDQTLRGTLETLQSYQQTYLDLTRGWGAKIDVSTTPLTIPQLMPAFMQKDPLPEPWTSIRADVGSELVRVRDQLVRLALPRVLGLLEAQPAEATETVPAYLQRIESLAQQKSDWNLLLRIMEMKQTLQVGVGPEIEDTVKALRFFNAGLEQERASDYVAAAQSFQTALQTGAQIPPAELVGGHLERLRHKHASEFATAIGKLEPPPSTTESTQWSVGYLLRKQEQQRWVTPKPPVPTFLTVPASPEAK